MNRRALLAAAAGALAGPLGAKAQPQPSSKVYRVGVLLPLGRQQPPILATLLAAMRDHGWTEDRDFVVELRHADGEIERLPALAADLVRAKVDVFVTMGTPATVAGKHATATIPIVFGLVGDAVGAGIVPSLARPGANITGMSLYGPEVFAKGLELLKEVVPRAQRVMVTQPLRDNPSQDLFDAAADGAARRLAIQLRRVDVRHAAEYAAAFEVAVKERLDAVLVSPYSALPAEAAAYAIRHRLPTMTLMGTVGQVGQLLAYGTNFREQVRHVAGYVDRILKGTPPGHLPVQQPTTFELVINLKTAKALGIEIPPPLRLRADQVIE